MKIIEYGLLGLLIFSPLPVASVHEWAVLTIQLAVLAMMAVYILMRERPQNNEYLGMAVRWPKIFFLAFFAFLVIQFIPLPKFLVKLLSPATSSYLERYAVDFSRLKFISLSIIPSYTFQKTLELLAYFLLGFLVFKTITRRHQFVRLYSVLVAVGAFEACLLYTSDAADE